MAAAAEAPAVPRVRSKTAVLAAPASGRVAANFFLLSGAEFLAKLMTFAAFTYLGRALGPERYGNLEFTLAVMVFFTLPVDFGLGVFGAREIARDSSRALVLYNDIAGLRLLLAGGSFVSLLAFVALIDKPAEVKLLLCLYGTSLFALPAFLQWFFQGHDRMLWVAVTSLLRQGVFAALLFLFLRPDTPLLYIGLFECLSVFGVAAFCQLFAARRLGFRLPRPRWNLRRWVEHFREALPIGLSELTWACVLYFATVRLAFVVADKYVGLFGTSHRAVMALHTFVWLYLFNLLPSISRCVSLPQEHLLRLMRRSLNIAAWGSILVSFLMTALSRELLTLAYGPLFAEAAPLFSVLVWMVPVALLSGHYRYTLIAYERQRWLLYSTALSGAACILLSFILIPPLGAIGAAFALLGALIVNFALAYYWVRRDVARIDFLSHLLKPLLAMCGALTLFVIAKPLSPWIAAAAAAAAYLGFFAAWQREDLLHLVGLLPKRFPWTNGERVRA